MPIIIIDGPASSGKGTVAKKVAEFLGFNYLDSGAIYRALGLMVIRECLQQTDTKNILRLIDRMKLSFQDGKTFLNGQDETDALRSENVSMIASSVGKIAEVRIKLLDFQRSFAKMPGLVTDGRDMGSVVFPEADLKVFLTASAEKRARRRHSQLQKFGDSGTIGAILRDIQARDKQDQERSAAPLVCDSTYKVLDNSDLSVEETVQTVINWYKSHCEPG
ncbi:MAG: cytidylate kinase [Burkholderiales bacterium]|jgi:cytidylate kinase|nr:cytidylate kinase [Burkholderiales bacterium]